MVLWKGKDYSLYNGIPKNINILEINNLMSGK